MVLSLSQIKMISIDFSELVMIMSIQVVFLLQKCINEPKHLLFHLLLFSYFQI